MIDKESSQLAKDIAILHAFAVKKYGGSEGALNSEAVFAAAARPYTSFGGQALFPTIYLQGAALAQSVAAWHAFNDANKRTAFLSLVHWLRKHAQNLEVSPEEGVSKMVALTTKELSLEDFATWLENNCQPLQKTL